jgi:hypothetical protein
MVPSGTLLLNVEKLLVLTTKDGGLIRIMLRPIYSSTGVQNKPFPFLGPTISSHTHAPGGRVLCYPRSVQHTCAIPGLEPSFGAKMSAHN